LRGAERRGNPDKNSATIRKGGKKAEESLDCFPPRFARGRNDGDRNRLFQRPVRAFPAKTESPETLYSQVLTQFRTRNRFPPPPSRGHAFAGIALERFRQRSSHLKRSIFLFYRSFASRTFGSSCEPVSTSLENALEHIWFRWHQSHVSLPHLTRHGRGTSHRFSQARFQG